MRLETLADRTEYMSIFGEAATVGGTAKTGIFDYVYAELNDVESMRPALTVLAEDAVNVVHGTVVIVRTVTYTVKNVQDDGTGITVLILGK